MSTSLNSRASLMKLAITQQTPTWCNNSFKAFHKALDKRSLKIQWSRHMTKWKRKQSVLLPLNVSSMPYTNNPPGMPLLNSISKQTGKHEGNAPKAIKVNNHSIKGLARPLLIPLQHQDHGTINQFQWILTKPEHQGETGEGKEEDCKGGM